MLDIFWRYDIIIYSIDTEVKQMNDTIEEMDKLKKEINGDLKNMKEQLDKISNLGEVLQMVEDLKKGV